MMESIPNLNEARLKIVYPQIADLPYAAQEAVNILRGNLQLSGKGIQAIAVTSASKEEGKSSVAIQLTKSFAALNKAVVYVDCDIRKSKTLRRYQINEQVEMHRKVYMTFSQMRNTARKDLIVPTLMPIQT